ncbi:MAG: ABC transporter permease [Chloroflexota bacterium]
MYSYIIRRLLQAIPVMLLVSTVVFLLLRLAPGDPTEMLLGPDATPERAAELRQSLGLELPLPVQWGIWFGNVLHGDLGYSIFLGRPVTQAIWERAEPTLMLTLMALAMSATLGLSLGVLAAVRHGGWADIIAMIVSLAGISMPTFWIGLNLILVFAVILGLLPVAGYKPLSDGLWQNVRYLILPAITLGLYDAALLARMTRSVMLEVLREDYVRTARSKGLFERRVILGHALRNALVPLVTIIGLTFASLIGGALITETVFNIPGVGRLLITAVLRRDYPLVQGIVLVIAVAYVLINLFIDILYGMLDPRVRRT